MTPEQIKQAANFWKISTRRAEFRLNVQENRELETSEGELGWTMQSDDGPVWVPAFMDL